MLVHKTEKDFYSKFPTSHFKIADLVIVEGDHEKCRSTGDKVNMRPRGKDMCN